MKKINFLFFVFSSLFFLKQIKSQFAELAPILIEGMELASELEPYVYEIAEKTIPVIKNEYKHIKPYFKKYTYECLKLINSKEFQNNLISHNKFTSIGHVKSKRFRRKKHKAIIDHEPRFNFQNNNWQDQVINVDTSLNQSIWEQTYLSKRQQTIKNAINNLTGNTNTNLPDYGSIDESNPPKIAFVCSGGGYRAMIMSLGFMLGASQITKNNSSLIDATSYISTLSGSTWFLGLMLTLNNYLQLPEKITTEGYLQIIKDYLKQTVTQQEFWNIKTMNLKAIEHHLLQKFLNNGGSVQPSDLWGAILADRLFKNLNLNGYEQNITFDLARNTLQNSTASPFPIFTCDICNCWPYICMETNPYTTGFVDFNSHLGGFIQTNYFESPFNQSFSQSLFPEESLGSFFGIFGSAYSFGLADVLEQIAENSESEWFKSFVDWVAAKFKIYKDRILRANVNNFMYKMGGYPLGNSEKITIADGGMSMINLPFIPLYTQNRNVDIFIVCDAAGDSTSSGYPELKEMADYAKAYNLPFPSLKNPKIYSFSTPNQTYKVSVFEDTNPNIPTIVYFPCYTPESTLKFDYSEDEFENVCGTIEMQVLNGRTAIIDAIKNKMDAKSGNWFGELEFDSPSRLQRLKGATTYPFRSCFGSNKYDDELDKYWSIN